MLKTDISKKRRSRRVWTSVITGLWLAQSVSGALAQPGDLSNSLSANDPSSAKMPMSLQTPLTRSALYTKDCLIAQLTKPQVAPVIPTPVTTDSKAAAWTTIRNAVAGDQIAITILGDGVHTSHVRLALTNKTKSPLVVFIPANEILNPGEKGIQRMMVLRNSAVKLLPGVATDVELRTVCASIKSVPPPPDRQVAFTSSSYGDDKIALQLSAIIAAADELERSGAYKGVPMKKERREQIQQLAIWKVLGEGSTNPDDKVSADSIESDLLRQTADLVTKNPDLLAQLGEGYSLGANKELVVAGKKKKELRNNVVNPIFEAIDLTVRKSQDPNLKNVAPLPPAGAWDTFIGAGERAYNTGEFVEASEVLEAAVNEAEKFGETDPRLSRSLVSRGLCFMDFGNYDAAEPDFNRALHLRETVSGPQSIPVAQVDNDLGLLKQRLQSYPSAQNFFQKALAIADTAGNSDTNLVTLTLDYLGRNFCLQGQGDQAEPLLKRALAVAMLGNQEGSKGLTSANPQVAEIETNLATAYTLMGKFTDASKLFDKALATDTAALGPDHPYIAQILDGVADSFTRQNQHQNAENIKKKAEEIREKSLGKNKAVAALPLSYDALTRVQLYSNGAKEISSTIDQFVMQGETLKVPSLDKFRINRPVKNKWALVIGISKFEDPTINLKYASKDAQDFATYLKNEANFAPDHVHVLVNEQASRKNILAEIGDKYLPRVAGPDDLVIIFLSSHGSPSRIDHEGVNYLVAYDTDKNSLFGTGIAMEDLTKMIKARVHADRTVLVLDACHSGAANVAKGLVRQANFDANSIAQGSGQLVICSSQPDQVSWESKRYQNGVFTHQLLEALRKAPTTKLGDAINTMQEEVSREVQMDRNGEQQQPVLKSAWEGNDLILAAPSTENRPGLPQEFDTPVAVKTVSTDSATKSIGASHLNKAGAVGTKPAGTKAQAKSAAPIKH